MIKASSRRRPSSPAFLDHDCRLLHNTVTSMHRRATSMARKRKITFVGAGSIVFTRELLGDIFLYPELAGATISLMDIDRDRLEMARLVAEELKKERGCRNPVETHLALE